jgi:L-seryl-tRNA(Ser) seleniumtransferase
MKATVLPVESIVGGGTAPRSRLPSHAIALCHRDLSVEALLARLRGLDMPIVARAENDRVLLDLRTVEPELDPLLITSLQQLSMDPEDTRNSGS